MFLPVFKNNIIFNHDSKLPRIFRMAVIGKSGSGKSVLTTQMILKEDFFDINQMYFYAKSLKKQPEINNIIYAFNKNLSKQTIINLFRHEDVTKENFKGYVDEIAIKLNEPNEVKCVVASNANEMIDENDLNEKRKNLVIFDDFQTDDTVNKIAESYFNNARKTNTNLIYIAQRYSGIPKCVKSNLNFVIAFNQRKRDADEFFNDCLSTFMDRADFLKLKQKTWDKDFHYIAVNLDNGKIFHDIFEEEIVDSD